MSKHMVKVKIDVHEPPEITSAVDSHDEVEEYVFDSDFHADLEIDGIGFERKTVEDYNSSLQQKRLDDQTRRMGQRYDHAYVLIDGDMSETDSPFKSNIGGPSLRGSMASLTAREQSGVHAVVPCSNPALLVDYAIRLARKHIEDSDREFIPVEPADPDASVTLRMYLQVPNVGPKTAKKLEEKWPTIKGFIENATYDDLIEIDGIGSKTAPDIIDAFV